MKNIKKVDGNQCIQLLMECINNSSNTYQEEWSKLKWENGIDWESMNYYNAIKIAKILGLHKNSVETVILLLNKKFNKNISDSVKMTFQAIKYKISKTNLIKYGGGNNDSVFFINKLLSQMEHLLSKINKKMNNDELIKIQMLISEKILIDNKFGNLIDTIYKFNRLLDEDKISINDDITELTFINIENLLKNEN